MSWSRNCRCCRLFLSLCSVDVSAAGRMLGRIPDCVEFVVAHDDLGAAGVHHAFDGFEDPQLLTAAVDQVTDEDRLAVRMAQGAAPMFVSEFREQSLQSGSAAVNVTDDVVTLHQSILALGSDRARSSASATDWVTVLRRVA